MLWFVARIGYGGDVRINPERNARPAGRRSAGGVAAPGVRRRRLSRVMGAP